MPNTPKNNNTSNNNSSTTIFVPETRDEIDELIIQLYPDVEEREDEDITGTPEDMSNDIFESVDTSAHKFDCLIHAFLIGVSEPFRKLTQSEKNAFASLFRRTLLPELIEDEEMKNLLKREYVFLSEKELEKLEELYKINIVNFYKLTPGSSPDSSPNSTPNSTPKFVTYPYRGTFPKYPFIFIYNPDNVHFRGVRTKKGGHSYKFSHILGVDLHESYVLTAEDAVTTKICKVKIGDKVKYEEKEYVVEGLHYDDETDPPECDSVKLKDVKDLVPIDKITKVTNGGRRQHRTRRGRRNRRRQTRRSK